VQKPAERKVTAEVSTPTQVDRALAQPLGEHPAVLVSRSWGSRALDPNTFIVLHPAGPTRSDASASSTADSTSYPAPRTVKVASVVKK
jgi:hypothetical protein